MIFNPKDIHIILIGYNRQPDYRINLELLRSHFSFGKDLWITTVYNGEQDELPSGIGENTFIYIGENRGYGLGALDAFNKGLSFAATGQRPIVAIFNFDVWFYKEDGFKLWVEDFIKSEKEFGSGYLPDHDLPMTDCMIFNKSILGQILPIKNEVCAPRLKDEKLQKMYEGTELGFENMEEWTYLSISPITWWKFQRDGAPRYRFTEKYTLSHQHDYEEKAKHLVKYISNFDHIPTAKQLVEYVRK
jgi:hypothetical protein